MPDVASGDRPDSCLFTCDGGFTLGAIGSFTDSAHVALDLPTALQAVYDKAAYNLSSDDTDLPPPPALSEGDRDWMAARLFGQS